jgi:hypothetical protein
MARTSLEKRQRIRALEAKRDALLGAKKKNHSDLAKVRAELKVARVQ